MISSRRGRIPSLIAQGAGLRSPPSQKRCSSSAQGVKPLLRGFTPFCHRILRLYWIRKFWGSRPAHRIIYRFYGRPALRRAICLRPYSCPVTPGMPSDYRKRIMVTPTINHNGIKYLRSLCTGSTLSFGRGGRNRSW